ncbi:beta-lactamase family protein [Lujinxingia vulgaris]|uniref:Beta-lactamase family protein n=1 Tax=Lujinxingia vulgaris TaxID=2600176 RepID=A0A5C6X7A5_9DELT|nr:serine hydrolase domain-containing protein [Lujinxingia vulgaris]TXD36140.1 beta-lactamase family protein [Lujinxingia vulgaris]
MYDKLPNNAPYPARGSYADGYEPVARVFARQLERGEEVGAGFTVYRRGECVVDLWGGMADVASKAPWREDTRVVLFSVTKGFVAMALHLLASRGKLDWDAPVETYWPGFARNGKEGMTVATLLGHRGGLAGLDTSLTMDDVTNPARAAVLLEALESQKPLWEAGSDQGYHAITFGMYARELFERICPGADLGEFLRRELFEPLGSDVYLGTPAQFDKDIATLYPPAKPARVAKMLTNALTQPQSTEARVLGQFVRRGSPMRRAFLNPQVPGDDVTVYNQPPARRAVLGWASATGSAHGVARAYLPFASKGKFEGQRYLKATALKSVYARQGWSQNDLVLQKPIGWSHGFCKEERHLFSPNPESFGHPGMGGALGWADPVEEIAIGYAMNFMDWRIRSPRALALCRALYDSPGVIEG